MAFDLLSLFAGTPPKKEFNTLTPQQSNSQAFDIATGLIPQYTALNKGKSQADIANQLGVENSVYGSSANQLQQGAVQNLLDSLRNPISPSITADILRNAGQNNGLGASQAGRNAMSVFTGLQQQQLQNQATQNALNFAYHLPSTSYGYNPIGQQAIDPYYLNNQVQAFTNQQNDINNYNRQYDFQKQLDQVNSIGRLLGTIGGAAAGTAVAPGIGTVMGAQAGGQIGGSLFGGGQQAQAGQNAGFNSILQGLVFNQQMGGMGQGGINNPYKPAATPFYE